MVTARWGGSIGSLDREYNALAATVKRAALAIRAAAVTGGKRAFVARMLASAGVQLGRR